jgi:hypothetical protein
MRHVLDAGRCTSPRVAQMPDLIAGEVMELARER